MDYKLVPQIYGVCPLLEMLQITHTFNHDDALKRLIGCGQIGAPFPIGKTVKIADFTLVSLVHKPRQQVEIAVTFLLRQFENAVVPGQ